MKESLESSGSKSISESDSETTPKSNRPLTEYEKKRIERIKENKARMEALKLPTLASSLLTPSRNKKNKNKGKKNIWKKKDDDEEYKPSDDDEEKASSSSEQGEDDLHTALHSADKGKLKQSIKKKKPCAQKHVRKIDFMDDDQALQQAIALSLEDSLDISHAVLQERDQKRKTDASDMRIEENKGRTATKVETDKRKKTRRLNTSSRMQITEDQVIIRFFQFDEAGKGGISLKDLKRVAVDHDFGWSDDEMTDMIHFFDSGCDGKLNLEDFRKILHRCNMVKE